MYSHMTDKGSKIDKSVMNYMNEQFETKMNWSDAEYCVKKWGGPFALKGVMSVEDAKKAIDIGCTAIIISNHGGRQLMVQEHLLINWLKLLMQLEIK